MSNEKAKWIVDGKSKYCSSGYEGNPLTGEAFTETTPRSNNMEGVVFRWPKTKLEDGREVKIIYSAFTAEEKKAYAEMRKNGGTGTSVKKDAVREGLLAIQKIAAEQVKDAKALAAINAAIEKILPPDPTLAAMQKKVAAMSDEQKAALIAALGL